MWKVVIISISRLISYFCVVCNAAATCIRFKNPRGYCLAINDCSERIENMRSAALWLRSRTTSSSSSTCIGCEQQCDRPALGPRQHMDFGRT